MWQHLRKMLLSVKPFLKLFDVCILFHIKVNEVKEIFTVEIWLPKLYLIHINMTTVISKHFRTPIFMDSFAWFKGFILLFSNRGARGFSEASTVPNNSYHFELIYS